MSNQPRQQVVLQANQPPTTDRRNECVQELFEQQVRRRPEAIAALCQNQQLTYRGLNQRANRLAGYLRSLGVGPEINVGICLERSLEMVIATLAVLKAGGAYVPLDSDYPPERLRFMLDDAQVKVVLSQQSLLKKLPAMAVPVICLDTDWEKMVGSGDEDLPANTSGDNAAYVIYTSGSTGRPKGVTTPHRAIINLILDAGYVDLQPADRMAQAASVSFDAATFELWGALLNGACLVVIDQLTVLSPGEMERKLRAEQITALFLTTSLFNQIARVAPGAFSNLRYLVIGGEAADPQCVAAVLGSEAPENLINGYGPTEATTFCSTHLIRQVEPGAVSLPIGLPIRNMQAYVLDQDLQPVTLGVAGELCVGGVGLGRGYLNRPEATAERFMPHPYGQPGERLYRTGDLAYWRPEGLLECLGRTDYQVKIRGFRIELGEIEVKLREHPAVEQAVVLAPEVAPGRKQLMAYVVQKPDADQVSFSDLQSYLSEKLPTYMVPKVYVALTAMPLTTNGKVDRKQLPAPHAQSVELEQEDDTLATATEERLAEIWAEVLQLRPIRVQNNFFELGGHSLLAAQVISRVRETFHVDLPLSSIFEAPVLSGLAERINLLQYQALERAASPIVPVSRDQHLPLSCSQERVWFLEQLDPSSKAYHFQARLRLTGRLNLAALEQSLAQMVQRHEILRTTFPEQSGRPGQVIHEVGPVSLRIIELQHLDNSRQERITEQLIGEELTKKFDLRHLPLIRWRLFSFNEREHLLLHIEHHLIHDGWSFNVFLRELLETYTAFTEGTAYLRPPSPVQFADFAVWQRGYIETPGVQAQLEYWRKKLADRPPVTELPTDRARPALQTFRGALMREALPLEVCKKVRSFSIRQGVSLFVTMLTAFVALIYRYAGQDDLCIGSSMANRQWPMTEGLIGMLVNNVVLRAQTSAQTTFRELLSQVRQIVFEAYENQDVPFQNVVQSLYQDRDLSVNPLFQIMFNFHNAPVSVPALSELRMDMVEGLGNHTAKFDLGVIVIPCSESRLALTPDLDSKAITVLWEYNTDLYEPQTLRRMVNHYQRLLEGMAENLDRRVAEAALLDDQERQELVVAWNDTASEYPEESGIGEIFRQQAECTPNRVAVVFEDQHVTYEELNRRADQVAHYLQARGVGPEKRVGLCVERSVEMIVAMLGIVKAGGVYVPLDVHYPQERLRFMLEDAGVEILLTQESLASRLPADGGALVLLDHEQATISQFAKPAPVTGSAGEHLAYIAYTSGSTGKPKGVCVCHRGVVRLVRNTNYVKLGAEEIFLQFAPTSFDAATFEIWGALLNGARLLIFPPYTPSVEELGEWLAQHPVTILWLTAGLFHRLVEHHPAHVFQHVRQLLAGGEAISVTHARRFLQACPQCKLINGYGPTENTTFSVCGELSEVPPSACRVSIGKPIANSQTYVLDQEIQPVAVGIAGELYVAGDGLARGYWQRPELTAEKFIPNPFSRVAGARLYRTGDLARHRADGNLEFMARMDQQVKLRGFRIEPGEIEARLEQHPDVKSAVVVVREREDGDKRLVAYLVAKDRQDLSITQLRDDLSRWLPEYMIPSVFLQVEALPLTANGKVDRQSLPDPGIERPALEQPYVAPRTPIEEALASTWAEVLQVSRVGVHDNFFHLGGHSLLATQVISRVRETYHLDLPLRSLFEESTVARFAEAVQGALIQRVEQMSEQEASELLAMVTPFVEELS